MSKFKPTLKTNKIMETMIKEVLVTPLMAERLLRGNTKNRRLNTNIVNQYARIMASGLWKRNTFELIKIDKFGILIDGQYRLSAVLVANTPVWFHVAYNVDSEIMDVIDTGKTRNSCDVFHIAGVKNSNTIPTMIKMHMTLMEKYKLPKDFKITAQELFDVYNERKQFYDYIGSKTQNYYAQMSKLLSPSHIGGFFAYISDCFDIETAEEFIGDMTRGISERTTAINLLRKKLMDDKLSRQTSMPQSVKIALILKTFRHWKLKKNISILKFDPERDDFPFLH